MARVPAPEQARRRWPGQGVFRFWLKLRSEGAEAGETMVLPVMALPVTALLVGERWPSQPSPRARQREAGGMARPA